MAKQLQLRRGTTTENNAFKGAQGELTYDTQRNELRIHDGSTTGGFLLSPKCAFTRNWTTYINEDGKRWASYREYNSGWGTTLCEIIAKVNRGQTNTLNFPYAVRDEPWNVSITCYNAQRYAWCTSFTSSLLTFNAADDASLNNDGWFCIRVIGEKA